jgi:hypothetical protein
LPQQCNNQKREYQVFQSRAKVNVQFRLERKKN